MNCPYCNGRAVLRDSSIIYNGVSHGLVYICENFPVCDSYVGTHRKTLKPLGRLADKELRALKQQAHKYFDFLWKNRLQKHARKRAYKWLCKQLDIQFDECHIGYFDNEMTLKVIKICKPLYIKLYERS